MSDTEDVAKARRVGLDPGILGLTIFPTEKCNFRCVYCYEEFPNTRLTDSIALSIMRLITRRSPGLHALSLGWFGGEPLLENSRMLEISRHAQKESDANGIKFHSHVTTNGYLLNFGLFEELISAGIDSFQISLDGSEVWHNLTRRMPGSSSTFCTIMANLLAMRRSTKKFDVTLRVHFHKSNAESVLELLTQLSEDFGGDVRFKINLQRIINHTPKKRSYIEFADDNILLVLDEKVRRQFSEEQLLDASAALRCCYASMPNHFVIRANGKVQKCTVALYDERNDVGELTADGSFLWASQNKLRSWSAGLFKGDLEEMGCPWRIMNRKAEATA